MANNYGTQIVADVEELNSFISVTDKEIVSVNNHGAGFIILYKIKTTDPEMEEWIKYITVEPI